MAKVEINLDELEIKPVEVAELICVRQDGDFEIAFMNHYFDPSNWPDADIEDISIGLDSKVKETMRKLIDGQT